MLKKILLSLFISGTIILAAPTAIQEKEKNFRNDHANTPAAVHKTYKDATADTNVKNWNNKDWETHMQKNGVFDTGLIGNSQNNASSLGSEVIHNANPNELSTATLRENSALNDNKSLYGYSDEVQKSIFDGNNARQSGNLNITQTTKCYIAREMPIRFKCSKTGLIYGAGINTGGSEAQKLCETECYEQFSCVNVSPASASVSTTTIANTKLTSSDEKKTASINITNGLKISYIEFDAKSLKDRAFIDIIITSSDGTEKIINKKMLLKEQKYNLKINQFGTSLKIVVYGDKKGSEVSVENIVITFKKEDKFICPTNQDISGRLPGEFAYLCPSGKIKTLTGPTGSYKICEDYGVIGDNSDGTFGTAEGCNNSCKTSHSCSLDNTALSTASLQNFREGCIEGQSDCNLDTCKSLRLNKAQVLNENIFHGDFEPKPTVVNGALIKGAERPKVLLDEDVDFMERSKEEWKDGAYNDMVKRGSYRATKFKINEDTNVSNAYNIGVASNSIDGTAAGSSVRSLYWVFKPKAFDVNAKSYRFYAVLEVIVDNLKQDAYGNAYREKDKILYVKTSADDFFKPFARKKAFARKSSNQVEDAEVLTSTWEYQYFNTSSNNWFSHSSSLTLEHFKNEKINIDGPFLRIPIVSNYNRLMYQLPGLIRQNIKNGPMETKVYTGTFDGSGQSITSVKLFIDYSQTSTLSYSSVVDKIDKGEWTPVYNNASTTSSPTAVVSDTMIASDSVKYHNTASRNSKEDIEIFLYGEATNKSGYTRIKPKAEDIGKKGFIYIFAQ